MRGLETRRPYPEVGVWALVSVLLAAAMTWPTLRHPRATIPQDIYDPSLQAWQVSWVGHALLHDPRNLWQANVSYPQHNSLAFSDSLLGYAPAGFLGDGPVDALLRYNLLFVFAYAFACFGAYCLIRQLGGSVGAAAVAGVAFAYAPWRLAHGGHLNVLSTGGIVLALALLARGHGWSLTGGYRPDRVRARWIVAGWAVAAWQITLGFGVGIPFGYVLAGVCLVSALVWLGRRPRLPRRLLVADLTGGLFFGGVVYLMSRPYFAVLEEHPDAVRSVAWLELFSPPLRGFFTAPAESWLMGDRTEAARQLLTAPAEMAVLPGFVLVALALAGLFVSRWSVRARLFLALGVVVSVWLAMGTETVGGGRYGYLLLFDHLPGFDSSRTPGRLVLWTTVLLCILAAGAVSRVSSPLPVPGLIARVAVVAMLVAVVAEGRNQTEHPEVPTSPVAFSSLTGPTLVLPTGELEDLRVMLWSTDGFGSVVNGSSGYNPPQQGELRERMKAFPDAGSVGTLRELGVRTVVVTMADVVGTEYEQSLVRDLSGLGVTRTDTATAAIFTIS
ncbi:hypothetical protein [Kineosporia succinea]|uniref:Uncharacterized protein n=1 Tax=Kineosporia succinea TaxID=84632 RepID=A0ABT9NX91_9ACTN|nr:hypothetical protein [Kineosporia succinea]MDP9825048.1 hypothetical protein [Kineosporia succinea]